MHLEPYRLDELKFAYCYRLYVRWRTYRVRPVLRFAELTQPIAQTLVDRFGLHLLEWIATPTDTMGLVSLLPHESVAAAVSKLKGQTSKWLRETAGVNGDERLFSRGYFAATAGKSTREVVAAYLDGQGEHHGYADHWDRPPVYVGSYRLGREDEERLLADHSHTLLRLHCVLSTWQRRGVFSRSLAERIANAWHGSMPEQRFALEKVSFVPDHVHLALRIHPSTKPATLLCDLMNRSQEIAAAEFRRLVRPPAVERLWQPSAYLGNFGELASPQIARYLRNWQDRRGE